MKTAGTMIVWLTGPTLGALALGGGVSGSALCVGIAVILLMFWVLGLQMMLMGDD